MPQKTGDARRLHRSLFHPTPKPETGRSALRHRRRRPNGTNDLSHQMLALRGRLHCSALTNVETVLFFCGVLALNRPLCPCVYVIQADRLGTGGQGKHRRRALNSRRLPTAHAEPRPRPTEGALGVHRRCSLFLFMTKCVPSRRHTTLALNSCCPLRPMKDASPGSRSSRPCRHRLERRLAVGQQQQTHDHRHCSTVAKEGVERACHHVIMIFASCFLRSSPLSYFTTSAPGALCFCPLFIVVKI